MKSLFRDGHTVVLVLCGESLYNDINIVKYDDNKILGLEIKTNDFS